MPPPVQVSYKSRPNGEDGASRFGFHMTSIPRTSTPGPKLMTLDTALRFGGQKYTELETGNSEVDRAFQWNENYRLIGNVTSVWAEWQISSSWGQVFATCSSAQSLSFLSTS